MTGLNVASRDNMKAADIIDYVGASPFEQALQLVKPDSDACIIAALTVFIMAGGDAGTISSSIDPAFDMLRTKIFRFCAFRPCLLVILHICIV